MRIFITGASGFVGRATTKHLAQAGHDVRTMSRSEKSDAVIAALGGKPARCDLDDVTAAHIGDAEAVVHAAAFVQQWGPRDAWKRFNVDATARMLAVSREAGVKRFIHIGTEASLFHGQHVRDADETYPLAPNSPYPYAATKAQAEMLVRAANTPGFETIVLRPRFIWGPEDGKLALVKQKVAAGDWVWVDGGRNKSSTTHIANLTHAIELALTKGRAGEVYFILDDRDSTMREMFDGFAKAQGVTLPDKSIPGWVASATAIGSEFAWSAFGLKGNPPLTRFIAVVLTRDCTLKDDKAHAEMGYQPVITIDDGMKQLAV